MQQLEMAKLPENNLEHLSLHKSGKAFMVEQELWLDLIAFLNRNCNKVVDYGKHASAMMTYEELWVKKNDYATWSIQHV